MPLYRIHYLTDAHMEAFREKPPRNAAEPLRVKHYEPAGEIEASSPYDAWLRLQQPDAPERTSRRALGVGDVLETESGEVLLCLFWGFEPAAWMETSPVSTSPEVVQALS